MKINSISILFLFLFAFSNISFACSQFEQDVPSCAYFTRADAVFIGKITKIERNFNGNEDGFWRRVHFKIINNFKGAKNSTLTLLTSPWEAACGLNVKKGQTWVVYAKYDDEEKVYISFRGNEYNQTEDKEYSEFLEAASKGKLKTSISGQLIPSGRYETNSYSGIKIKIEGNGNQQETETNSDGKFDFSSLSAGNYKVKLKFPCFASLLWFYPKIKFAYLYENPTIFEYDVQLKQGECDYKFFEVSKPSKSKNISANSHKVRGE